MINDNIKATGALKIEVISPEGVVKDTRHETNLVVTDGTRFIAERMRDAVTTAMSHMAIGTSSTAPSAGQTALVTQVARVSLTSTSVTNNTITYVATFPAGTPATSAAVTEAGIFNASTAGRMLARTTFPVVNKAPADSITITWTITIGAV